MADDILGNITASTELGDERTVIRSDGSVSYTQKSKDKFYSIFIPSNKTADTVFEKQNICNPSLTISNIKSAAFDSLDSEIFNIKNLFIKKTYDQSCVENSILTKAVDDLYFLEFQNQNTFNLKCMLEASDKSPLDIFATLFLFPDSFSDIKFVCHDNKVSILNKKDNTLQNLDNSKMNTPSIIFELLKLKNFHLESKNSSEEIYNKIVSCYHKQGTKLAAVIANQADNEKQAAERSNEKNPEVRQINLANVKVDPKDIEKIQQEAREAVVQAKLGDPVSTPPTLLKLQNYFSSVVRKAVSQETSGASQSLGSKRAPANTSPSPKNVPRPSVDEQMHAGSTRNNFILGPKAQGQFVIDKPATPEGGPGRKPDTAQNSGDPNSASASTKATAGSDSAKVRAAAPGIAGGTGPNSKISNTAAAATTTSPESASRASASVEEKAILSEIQNNILSILNRDPDYIRSVDKKLSEVDTQVRINGMLLGRGSKSYVYKDGQFIPR